MAKSGKIFGDVNRDKSGGLFGGKHVPPARDPRPKGSQGPAGGYRDNSGRKPAHGKSQKG